MKQKNIYQKLVFILFFTSFYIQTAHSQSNNPINPVPYNSGRLTTILVTESLVATTALICLHYLWYKKYPRSRFHFFNDNREWMNMDKAGHATTAYNISRIQYNMMQWSGINNRRATWIGGLTALGFQTIIEIFDGYSQNWGFSPGDMVANITGAALFIGQQLTWNEQRFSLGFSYHRTIYSKYNPEVLGNNKWQRWIKDYNGQTYWLSLNPGSFLSSSNSFPKWLDISFGYGSEGMTGATVNPERIGITPIPAFKRVRKYFLSVNANLQRIVNSKPLNDVLFSIPSIIKLPAPAIEFKKHTVKFHPVYF